MKQVTLNFVTMPEEDRRISLETDGANRRTARQVVAPNKEEFI